MILLQKPSITFPQSHLSKPKFFISVPSIQSTPDPLRWSSCCHGQNPNISVWPNWFSVPPRRPCQVSVMKSFHFGITKTKRSELPRHGSALAIALQSRRDGIIGLTEKPSSQVFCTSRSHLDFHIGATELGQRLVMVGFFVLPVYTPPPPLTLWESHQNETQLSPFILWERTTYSCVEIKRFHSYHLNLDF